MTADTDMANCYTYSREFTLVGYAVRVRITTT